MGCRTSPRVVNMDDVALRGDSAKRDELVLLLVLGDAVFVGEVGVVDSSPETEAASEAEAGAGDLSSFLLAGVRCVNWLGRGVRSLAGETGGGGGGGATFTNIVL